MRCTVPDGMAETTTTLPVGVPKRPSFALFARVCPARNATVSRDGVVPAGPRRTAPAAVEPVTVTFAATATAPDGTPHDPRIGNVRVPFAARAGPPVTPAGPRVSTMRHGGSVVSAAAGGSVTA